MSIHILNRGPQMQLECLSHVLGVGDRGLLVFDAGAELMCNQNQGADLARACIRKVHEDVFVHQTMGCATLEGCLCPRAKD